MVARKSLHRVLFDSNILIEYLSGVPQARSYFSTFLNLPITAAVAEIAGCTLITRNSRDFPSKDPAIRVPYQL